MNPVRVLIGCSPAEFIPAKVLEFTILQNTTGPVEIVLGYQSRVKHVDPIEVRNRPVTAFSFQRFTLPEHWQHEGRAIYLDSDMLCLGDLREVFEYNFHGDANILSTPGWQSAVMLMDCAACKFDLIDLVRDMDEGRFDYRSMMNLKAGEWFKVSQALPTAWNTHDRLAKDINAIPLQDAKIVHFTDMSRQPWLAKGHPWDSLWQRKFKDAVMKGHISTKEVYEEIRAKNVRPKLLEGNDKNFVPPQREEEVEA